MGKWPAGATAESLAPAGHLSTAATAAAPGRVGLLKLNPDPRTPAMTDDKDFTIE